MAGKQVVRGIETIYMVSVEIYICKVGWTHWSICMKNVKIYSGQVNSEEDTKSLHGGCGKMVVVKPLRQK